MTAPDPADVKACAQTCAAANVRRASRAVTKLYGQFMATTGLEPTQYSLLVACSLTGGATVSKLADVFVMDRSALARNLAIMEKRGLVKIRPGEDRRTRKVALTPFGESTLANAMPHWRAAQDMVEARFGAERLQQLLVELRALMQVAAPTDQGG
ncbi:MarR family winged helix-turn-helix transcriptional regulator [Methylocystis echinoides]|uniref:Homoprotocatechuate degradation operon regulator, HpaR n=1 Tax=Methylocystis echinoides TaxID=29468 RepID=A0A9W6LRC1_9HYPH|nr:MarR family winged helix-turn-helix transcriptional regulator [Methylocystis echinoides]GLI92124.1 homoprotocatechuate degradation operon regulator, HpaR [Methylocystis echinoides]